jgi:hypothetical protein
MLCSGFRKKKEKEKEKKEKKRKRKKVEGQCLSGWDDDKAQSYFPSLSPKARLSVASKSLQSCPTDPLSHCL